MKIASVVVAIAAALATSACSLSIDSKENQESDSTYSGCLKDKDVYVGIFSGVLTASLSAVCASNQDTDPELLGNLPAEIDSHCAKEIDGLGLGALIVEWNDQQILVPSRTCEPL